MQTAAFMAASLFPVMVGSCRYVKIAAIDEWVDLSHCVQIGTRADIRNRYDIRGGGVGDCLTAWCCRPCSLTQERREIELEEKSFY
jgi:Cys-rich protein (TIGR01571 family)